MPVPYSQRRSSRSCRRASDGDAMRVVGVALDERERLQDRVVHARGDLGALLEADPLGALGGELPEPRPEHEDERARDRARRDERPGRAEVAEQDHGARRRECDRRERGASRPAAASRRALPRSQRRRG